MDSRFVGWFHLISSKVPKISDESQVTWTVLTSAHKLCMHGHARLVMGICKSYSAYSKVRRRSSSNDRFIVKSLYFQLKNGRTDFDK